MHVVKHKSENDLLLTLGSGTSTARPRDGTGLDGQERQVRTGRDGTGRAGKAGQDRTEQALKLDFPSNF